MKITLVVVGRIKERFYADAVAEYARRLSAYCTLNIVEVADEKTKENMSPAEEAALLKKEGERILAKLPKDAYICALCIDGKQRDSVEMSRWMEGLTVRGVSHIVFLIGGSVGALAGMYLFRHKTKHRRFTVGMPVILLLQIALLLLLRARLQILFL